MLKFVIAAALTALLTTAAFAQIQPPAPSQAGAAPASEPAASEPAQDQEEADEAYAAYAGPGPGAVIENGVLRGEDPDANVRLDIRRDLSAGAWGN